MRKTYTRTTEMAALDNFLWDCKRKGVSTKLLAFETIHKNNKTKVGTFEFYTRTVNKRK